MIELSRCKNFSNANPTRSPCYDLARNAAQPTFEIYAKIRSCVCRVYEIKTRRKKRKEERERERERKEKDRIIASFVVI